MQKPPHPEEEYFAKLEMEQLKALAEKKRNSFQAGERAQMKKLHANHCPSCGLELTLIPFHGYSIRRCFNCGGAFLEKETLEVLGGGESHLFDRIVEIFKF